MALGFDIYLRISGRHLLYVKRSDSIEEARLANLHDKRVREVYIDEGDRSAYEEFLEASSMAALKDASLPLRDRSVIISGHSVAAVEDMHADPKPRENYERTRKAAANQVALLLSQPEALEQMLAIAKYDKTVYRHSVNVATLAIALGASLGAPAQTCHVMAVGGLLHDLGKSAGDAEVEQHPRQGAGLLLNKTYVSRDILDIILLHEERLDGKGYPAGVRKLDEIFQVVGLANLYDRLVTLEGADPEHTLEYLKRMRPAPYDPRLIRGLAKVLAHV